MKVKDLCGVILDDVQVYYDVPLDDSRVDRIYLNVPCDSEMIPYGLLDLEVICIFSLDMPDLIYVEVKQPELPIFEEVTV